MKNTLLGENKNKTLWWNRSLSSNFSAFRLVQYIEQYMHSCNSLGGEEGKIMCACPDFLFHSKETPLPARDCQGAPAREMVVSRVWNRETGKEDEESLMSLVLTLSLSSLVTRRKRISFHHRSWHFLWPGTPEGTSWFPTRSSPIPKPFYFSQREVCTHNGQCAQKESILGNSSHSIFLERFSLYFLLSAGCFVVFFSSALNFCTGFGEEPQENVEYVTAFKTRSEHWKHNSLEYEMCSPSAYSQYEQSLCSWVLPLQPAVEKIAGWKDRKCFWEKSLQFTVWQSMREFWK